MQLLDLPTELLLKIYKQCETPAQITTLNLVSRDLYSIWRFNAALISETVLRQYIECYDAALEVVKTFPEERKSRSVTGRLKLSRKISSPLFRGDTHNYSKVWKLNVTLISHARKASMVGDYHQRAGVPSGVDRRYVSTSIANILLPDYPYTRLLERETAIRVF